MTDDTLLIPLYRRDGSVAAHATIDAADAEQARHRWHLSAQGYAARRATRDGRRLIVVLHRELLGLAYGDPRQGDHIDLDRLNYRRSNLRIVTPAQNAQNRRAGGGSSRHRGVCFHKASGKWFAYGQVNRRRVSLGLHTSEDDAAAAARAWRAANMTHANEGARV